MHVPWPLSRDSEKTSQKKVGLREEEFSGNLSVRLGLCRGPVCEPWGCTFAAGMRYDLCMHPPLPLALEIRDPLAFFFCTCSFLPRLQICFSSCDPTL